MGIRDADELEALLDLEIAIQQRRESLDERRRQDWYGPGCLSWGCDCYDHAKGTCPEHPRARRAQRPPTDPDTDARPLHRLDELTLNILLGKDEAESFLSGVRQALEKGPIEDDPWVWLASAGRGFGKAYHVDTPTLTSNRGWVKAGEIVAGDIVFDESGRPCNVLVAHDPYVPEEAYRVIFDDGSEIEACADHLWVTWDRSARKALNRSRFEERGRFPGEWPSWRPAKVRTGPGVPREDMELAISMSGAGHSARAIERSLGISRAALARHIRAGSFVEASPEVDADGPGPRVRTTRELFGTQASGKRGDLNHSIPACGAIQYPEADLPIQPYVLGAWLGDGSSNDGTFAQERADMEELRESVERCGFPTTERSDPQVFGTLGLHGRIRLAGLKRNKHVPRIYLESSVDQRKELLAGLMDTDGTIGENGHCEFTNTNPSIARGFEELARGLGIITTWSEGRATLYGKDCGPKYRVTFRPPFNPFRLARKRARFRPLAAQWSRSRQRMIVKVERIANPGQMRCLTVDSKHNTFLVGRAMIPTHNTRTGAEWIHSVVIGLVERRDVRVDRGQKAMVALVGETIGDVVRVMIEGPSGLLSCQKQGYRTEYQPSKSRVVWYDDEGREVGIGIIASAQEYGRLRGPQFHASWCDELAKWKYTQAQAWEQVQFSCRLAPNHGILVTTTPQPTGTYKEILFDPHTWVSTGSTYENSANLDPVFFQRMRARYEGTSLGAQELYATLLGDDEGALWSRALIDLARDLAELMPRDARGRPVGIPWYRCAVAVDPNTTGNGDEAGIVVAATGTRAGEDMPRGLVIEDCSVGGGPNEWARRSVEAYVDWGAQVIVVERNNGGEMCELVIRQACKELHSQDPHRFPAHVPIRTVWASRGKRARAEPVKGLYEQGRILHLARFAELEEEMRTWRPDSGMASPNRLDALVWAITYLMVGAKVPPRAPAGGQYASSPAVPGALARPDRARRPEAAMRRTPYRPRLGANRGGR